MRFHAIPLAAALLATVLLCILALSQPKGGDGVSAGGARAGIPSSSDGYHGAMSSSGSRSSSLSDFRSSSTGPRPPNRKDPSPNNKEWWAKFESGGEKSHSAPIRPASKPAGSNTGPGPKVKARKYKDRKKRKGKYKSGEVAGSGVSLDIVVVAGALLLIGV